MSGIPRVGDNPKATLDPSAGVESDRSSPVEADTMQRRFEDSMESCVEGGRIAFMGLAFGILWGAAGIFRSIFGSIQSLFFGRRSSEIQPVVSEEQVQSASHSIHQCFDGILSLMKWCVHSVFDFMRQISREQ